ncbi:MAG: hypothetical protein HS117_27190 [Verrucomicrobiaceae bacterium]|nr:hypothetical protein [Verrucomicrobiaceae bacterium]
MTAKLLVLGASLLWIAFCMRFWYAIDRDHVWQRRFIAIGAGVGGGLIYLLGTMILTVLRPSSPDAGEPAENVRMELRAAPAPGKP